ncbi:MAG TPA: SagB/ThcOx family dehydrogenase, partial [Mycobacteriales bacterium]|nr:SagB/ThcOx family dehydrogenase [Mycobacteriales bacterium]
RRSIRDYAKEPMELATLASVLRAAVGKVGEEDGYGVRALPLFPYPSTGGLSAFEVGVLAQRVDGLEPGYYLYDQVGYQLVPRIRGDLRLALQDVTFESEWLLYAPVVLVLVHRARKFEWKYHTRGYRMAHLDMGAALQNLYLSAWASRVGTCAVAGFFDEAINTLLGYDGIDDYVSLVVAMGEPATPLLSQQE